MDIFLISSIILFILLLIVIIKYNVDKRNKWQNEINQRKEEIDKELSTYIQQANDKKQQLYQEQVNQRDQINKDNENYYSSTKKQIEEKLIAERNNADIEIQRQKQMLVELDNSYNQAVKTYNEKLTQQKCLMLHVYDEGVQSCKEDANEVIESYRQKIEEVKSELESAKSVLNEYQLKVNAVNEEILRNRAIQEKQDFYKIQIDESSKEDIQLLLSIREKLHKQEFLNKMVYDNYISKPVKEMIKRVLGNKSPSGIYRITNIQTNEAYIGKSTDISTRWQNHIKAAEGLDGVADSQFQRALKKYGVDNWTFEVLEECPKEKLTEREKYYIDFYNTKTYGYNQRTG